MKSTRLVAVPLIALALTVPLLTLLSASLLRKQEV